MDNVLLNDGLLWSGKKQKGSIQPDSWMFVFNWYNLHNWTSRRVTNSNHDDLWEIELEDYDAPRTDGGFVLNKFYRSKTIVITLCLTSPTAEWLNDLIDDLKFQTSKTQGFLDIIINWVVRRREATLTSLKFWRQNYNITFVQNVVLTFKCVNPLAFSLANITNTYNWISGNYVTEINYSWKVNCFPTIYFLVHSQTDLETISVDFNWYVFTIDEEIDAGDVLEVDGESKLVKLNWNVIYYNWPFPVLEPWLNHIEIMTNEWALINYDLIFIYKKLFL